MKTIQNLVLISIFLNSIGSGVEPPEIEQLRANYNRELAQVQSPVQRRYRDGLTQLKVRYTKAGQLEAAIAADAELKKLDMVTKHGNGDASVVERLLGTKWEWYEGQSIEFRAAGKGVFQKNKKDTEFEWKVNADGKINYRFASGGAPYTIELVGDHITITPATGKPWTGKSLGKAQ